MIISNSIIDINIRYICEGGDVDIKQGDKNRKWVVNRMR